MQFDKLQKAFVEAMKARDKERKEAISALISAVKKTAIDAGCRDNIPDDMVDKAVLKEIKTVKEQIDTCPASRQDLLDEYTTRYNIMQEFAPVLMSEEEIRKVIDEKFSDVVATGNKGMIMKAVMAELKGKADGKLISSIVNSLVG